MIRMFVWHRVRNYEKWRKGYDAFWREKGVKGSLRCVVYQDVMNPNIITVCQDFNKLARAKAFAKSSRLRKAMGGAGVRSPVAIWFADTTRKTPKPAKRRRARRRKAARRKAGRRRRR